MRRVTTSSGEELVVVTNLDELLDEEPVPPYGPDNPRRPLRLPEHFSFSAADTFDQCPRQWLALYVWGVPDPSGPEAAVGTFGHSVLEHLLALPVWARGGEGLRLAVALASVPVDPKPGRDPEAPPTREQKREAIRHVITVMGLPEIARADVVALEYRIETTIAGVPFVGLVDHVGKLPSSATSALDYKFGKRKSGTRAVGYQRQLRLYTSGLRAEGIPVEAAGIVWAKAGAIDDVPIDDASVAEAERWLRMLWAALNDAVDSGVFRAEPSALCSWCAALPHCPEGQEAVLARSMETDSRGKPRSLGEHGVAWLASRET